MGTVGPAKCAAVVVSTKAPAKFPPVRVLVRVFAPCCGAYASRPVFGSGLIGGVVEQRDESRVGETMMLEMVTEPVRYVESAIYTSKYINSFNLRSIRTKHILAFMREMVVSNVGVQLDVWCHICSR